MQDDERDVEEVEVLLRDRLLEIADDAGELERERLGDHAEDRDADLDRAADRLVLDPVVALVLDEPAELADLLHRQVGQDRQPVVDPPAVHFLDGQQRPFAGPQRRPRGRVGRGFERRVAEDLAVGDGARRDVDVVRVHVVERLVLEPALVDDVRLDEVRLDVLREAEAHQLDQLLLAQARRAQRGDGDAVAVRDGEDRVLVRAREELRQPDLGRRLDEPGDVRVGVRVVELDAA